MSSVLNEKRRIIDGKMRCFTTTPATSKIGIRSAYELKMSRFGILLGKYKSNIVDLSSMSTLELD